MIGSLQNGWGFIEVYIASYLIRYNPSLTTSIIQIQFLIMYLSESIGAQSFNIFIDKFGYKKSLVLAFLIYGFGIQISYYFTSFSGLMLTMLCNGIQEGLRMLICPIIMMSIMPNRVGLSGSLSNIGLVIAGYYWGYFALYY